MRVFDYTTILGAADKIVRHPIHGKSLDEVLAHEEFEFPIHEAFGIAFTIALFRAQVIDTPDGHTNSVDGYLFNLGGYHNFPAEIIDLEGNVDYDYSDETLECPEDVFEALAIKTGFNLLDLEIVAAFYMNYKGFKTLHDPRID